MDRVLAASRVAQCCCRQIGQSERGIKLAHQQQAAIRTYLRAPKLQPHAAVEADPITPIRSRTHRVIHEACLSSPSTL
jgi:hypothetical protein